MKKYVEAFTVIVLIPLIFGLIVGSHYIPYIVHGNVIYVSASIAGLVYYLSVHFGNAKEDKNK